MSSSEQHLQGSRVHTIKTDRPYFEAVWEGRKKFELRYDDSGYQTGDKLCLVEIIDELLRKTSGWYPSTPGTHEAVRWIEPEIIQLREIVNSENRKLYHDA